MKNEITKEDINTFLSHLNSHRERMYESEDVIYPKTRKDVCLVVRSIEGGSTDETLYMLWKNKKGIDYELIADPKIGRVKIGRFALSRYNIEVDASGSSKEYKFIIKKSELGLR